VRASLLVSDSRPHSKRRVLILLCRRRGSKLFNVSEGYPFHSRFGLSLERGCRGLGLGYSVAPCCLLSLDSGSEDKTSRRRDVM
jgi:hypothetical protein